MCRKEQRPWASRRGQRGLKELCQDAPEGPEIYLERVASHQGDFWGSVRPGSYIFSEFV